MQQFLDASALCAAVGYVIWLVVDDLRPRRTLEAGERSCVCSGCQRPADEDGFCVHDSPII